MQPDDSAVRPPTRPTRHAAQRCGKVETDEGGGQIGREVGAPGRGLGGGGGGAGGTLHVHSERQRVSRLESGVEERGEEALDAEQLEIVYLVLRGPLERQRHLDGVPVHGGRHLGRQRDALPLSADGDALGRPEPRVAIGSVEHLEPDRRHRRCPALAPCKGAHKHAQAQWPRHRQKLAQAKRHVSERRAAAAASLGRGKRGHAYERPVAALALGCLAAV